MFIQATTFPKISGEYLLKTYQCVAVIQSLSTNGFVEFVDTIFVTQDRPQVQTIQHHIESCQTQVLCSIMGSRMLQRTILCSVLA